MAALLRHDNFDSISGGRVPVIRGRFVPMMMMIFVINVFRRQGCPHLGQGHGPIVSSRFVPFTTSNYPTISDSVWTQSTPSIKFTHLNHVCDLNSLTSILDQGFKGGHNRFESLKPYGNELTFSWWGITVPKEEKRKIQNDYKQKIQSRLMAEGNDVNDGKLDEEIQKYFCTSPVFQSDYSLYGNFRIDLSITELEEAYKQAVGCQEVSYKQFGTAFFKQETLNVVVVSPKDDDRFSTELEVDESSYRIKRSDEGWTWTPESTSSEIFNAIINKYRRWDQVCFAFCMKKDQRLVMSRDLLDDIKPVNNCGFKLKGDGFTEEEAKEKLESIQVKRTFVRQLGLTPAYEVKPTMAR